MRFEEFKQFYREKGIISSKDLPFLGNPTYLRRQISEWLRKKWLIALKRGIYLVNDPLMLERISVLYIANFIYQPSYLSMEWALRYHQLIPEEVYQFTSVSTRKTTSFSNDLGEFSYRKMKKSLFWGFEVLRDKEWNVQIAYPEKALLDFFYLNKRILRKSPEYLETYRFQNLEILDSQRLLIFLNKFEDSGVESVTSFFVNLYKL